MLAGSAIVAGAVSIAAGGVAALAMPLGSPGLFALMVGVGLFVAALPSVMFLTGIRRIGSVRTGILMLFEPVVGVALAALFLAERLTLVQAAGGGLILLAALLVQRSIPSTTESTAIAPAPGGP
jgi:drug/metabolite transporter (DMT)-like permease